MIEAWVGSSKAWKGVGHSHSVALLSFICIQALVHGSMTDALAKHLFNIVLRNAHAIARFSMSVYLYASL